MARRNRRQRGTQYTGILRSRNRTPADDRPQTRHSVERGGNIRWRIVSGVIVLCMSGLLALIFLTDIFFVRSIAVSNLRYMTREEVFSYADIANMHVLWVEPEAVRQRLLTYPTVASAQVRLSLPPNMVNITIQEREPALVWEQNSVAVWVDIQGNVMAQREERPDLVRIQVNDPLFDGPLGESRQLDTDIVIGVLQLQELLPDVGVWNYDSVKGLGYQTENGWDVWFGIGANMPEKLKIYDAIASDIIARGIQTREINIVDPDAPFRNDSGGS